MEETRSEEEVLRDMVAEEDDYRLRGWQRLAACDVDVRMALQEVWDIAQRSIPQPAPAMPSSYRPNPFTMGSLDLWRSSRRRLTNDLQQF